jgi:hypothetical protein
MPYELHLFRLRIFFVFLCVTGGGYADLPSLPKEEILDVFFRDLIDNTTAGYALYGEKPVDLQGVRELEQTMPGSKERAQTVLTLLAKQVLQQCSHKTGPCIFSIRSASAGYEILSIHRAAFLKTVQAEHLLFISRFGVQCTPQSILDQLVKDGFAVTFKKHPALQGIVLGYGTENAITYEIGSTCLKSPNPRVVLPFKISSKGTDPAEQMARITDPAIQKQLRRIGVYKPQNKKDKTKIPFSYLTDSPGSQKLIAKYQKTQLQIEKVLGNPRFLSDVCNRLGIVLDGDKGSSIAFSEEEKRVLPSIVARALWRTFPNQISPQFIAGMKDAVKREHLDVKEIKFLDVLWQRDPSSILPSSNFFKDLARDSGVECKIPGYLYFKIAQASASDECLTAHHRTFKARYLVEDFSGTPLKGSYELQETPTLCLEELMPALAHGLIGMRKGEIRDIYIHPDIAYGPSSEIGDGNALIVRVELLDLTSLDADSHLLPLELVDVHHYAPPLKSTEEFISFLEKHAYACGFRSWSYYKRAEPLISLDQVLVGLAEGDVRTLSFQEKMTLLKLEWQLSKSEM